MTTVYIAQDDKLEWDQDLLDIRKFAIDAAMKNRGSQLASDADVEQMLKVADAIEHFLTGDILENEVSDR